MTCHSCFVVCRKSGKRPDGLQRYRCSQCGKTFSERKDFGWIGYKQAPDEGAALPALRLIVEGNSIRSAERISGLDKKTILHLLEVAGEKCDRLMPTVVQNVPVNDVQADEIWSYCGKKEGHTRPGDDWTVGDAWCFIAIERDMKLVLAYEVGKRTVSSATRFIDKLAAATDPEKRFQLTTDGLAAYPLPVGTVLGDRVDYAQLVKVYEEGTKEEKRRYSPANYVKSIPTIVYGEPDERRICTSHIERQNGSLRQWCKRLTRLTYALPKKLENHKAALALHFGFYNFCRTHGSLKGRTPAMARATTREYD